MIGLRWGNRSSSMASNLVLCGLVAGLLSAGAAFAAYSSQAPASASDDRIAGATIRYTWTQGPVAGVTHEHVFGRDGTVVWRVLDGPQKGKEATEKQYAAVKVADDIYAISYLAASGNTLTVILNFRDTSLVGFASDARSWYALRGAFQIVGGQQR